MNKLTKEQYMKAKDIEYNIRNIDSILDSFTRTSCRCFVGVSVAYKSGLDWGIPKEADEQGNKFLFFNEDIREKVQGVMINELESKLRDLKIEFEALVGGE